MKFWFADQKLNTVWLDVSCLTKLIVFGFILFMLMPVTIGYSAANPYQLAVFYPEVQGRYGEVYRAILQGVQNRPDTTIHTRQLTKNETPEALRNWLEQTGSHAVVALGLRSYMATKDLGLKLPVVIGALVLSPNGISGISLSGAPEEFLQQLNHLTPKVKRVFVVYSKINSGWLVESARQTAKKYDMEIHGLEAKDSRHALTQYKSVLQQVSGETDAVWIPLDSMIPDKTVLPLLLESAWSKRFVIFSNNPSHVRKGALFSLYPDHKAMGRQLADMTISKIVNDDGPLVVPSEHGKVALNQRTAHHLGLNYSSNAMRQFDLVYPVQR
ncbi:MAG: ABC transporter substrate-binding protein [Magnetococcales bacterium]|nr:ABC transporter substrate-binding protein [Magnetococcales bacterium]